MHKIEDKYWKILIVGMLLLIFRELIAHVSWFAGLISSVWHALTPVTVGAVIAFFAYAPAVFLEKKCKKSKLKWIQKKARLISLVVVYIAFFLILFGFIRFLLPTIYLNLTELVKNLPAYLMMLEKWVKGSSVIPDFDILGTIKSSITGLLNMDNIMSSLSVVTGILSSVLTGFTAVILSVYLLADRERVFGVAAHTVRFILRRHYDRMNGYVRKTINLFYSYFIGLATDALLIGVITTVFLLIIKSPYAVLLGIIVMLGNLIPVFGPIVSAIILYILSAVSFGPANAIWVLVFQIVLGQVDGNYIQPKIISRSVNLSAVWIIISVIVFGNLFGPIGMMIGTPIVASIDMVVRDFKENNKNNQNERADQS